MFTAMMRSFQVRKRFTIIQLITIATMLHAAVKEWMDLDPVSGGRKFSYLLVASSQNASIGESSLRRLGTSGLLHLPSYSSTP